MRPGSKNYIRMLRYIYWFNVAFTAMCIPALIFEITGYSNLWQEGEFRFYLTLSFMIIGCFHFLSAFEPVKETPNWSMIYPELKKGIRK
jgi:hypothetical protein